MCCAVVRHTRSHPTRVLRSCVARHTQVERALAIPPARQKLMFRGLLKNDTDTLEQVCVVWCVVVGWPGPVGMGGGRQTAVSAVAVPRECV